MNTQQAQAVADETGWGDVNQGTQDPEEVRVIFSALDSFR